MTPVSCQNTTRHLHHVASAVAGAHYCCCVLCICHPDVVTWTLCWCPAQAWSSHYGSSLFSGFGSVVRRCVPMISCVGLKSSIRECHGRQAITHSGHCFCATVLSLFALYAALPFSTVECWRACLMSVAILRFKLKWRKLLSLYTNSGALKHAITLLRAVIIALPGHRSNNQPSARRRLSCWKWSAPTCCHGRYGVGDGNIGSTRCCLTISHSLHDMLYSTTKSRSQDWLAHPCLGVDCNKIFLVDQVERVVLKCCRNFQPEGIGICELAAMLPVCC